MNACAAEFNCAGSKQNKRAGDFAGPFDFGSISVTQPFCSVVAQ
jgi:hypothetical protein